MVYKLYPESLVQLDFFFISDILSKFMAPDQMSRTVSSFPIPAQGNFNSSMALQHLNSYEGHVSTLMASLPLSITEKAVEGKYIPLHESASVMTLLQDKIEEQNTVLNDCYTILFSKRYTPLKLSLMYVSCY